jgi:hypothetical protein
MAVLHKYPIIKGARMQITAGDYWGYKPTVWKNWGGKATLSLSNRKFYELPSELNEPIKFLFPDDVTQFHILDKEVRRPPGGILMGFIAFIGFGIVVGFLLPPAPLFALIFWAVWAINYKEHSITAAFEFKSGQKLNAILDDKDWQILRGFITKGAA